jgi:hypothetical protein
MAGVFLVLWLVAIMVGQVIGAPKHRAGWAWGLLLGWIGVIIVACLSDASPEVAKLTAKQREVAELEADLRLEELRRRQNTLSGVDH